MADAIVEIPETYYVGIPAGSDLDKEKFPMAFATVGGTDAAALKRKKTVDEWASRSRYIGVYPNGQLTSSQGPRYEMQNDWLEGFAFSSITSRSRTDNKVFDIQDPRGFSLQVYSDCMEDILLDGAIIKGEVQGKCCWARRGGKMYLLMQDSPQHEQWKSFQATKIEQKGERMVPGDIFSETGQDDSSREIFIGNVYRLSVEYKNTERYGYYSSGYNRPRVQQFRMTVNVDEKPWKGSMSVKEDRKYIYTRRSWPKKTIKLGHDDDMLPLRVSEAVFGLPPDWKGTWGTTLYFKSLADIRAFVAEHGPDYEIFREMFRKAHTNNDTWNYELLS